jgi:hypothetical protein
MILTIAMTLALLLGGMNAASSEDTTPPDENDARIHIIDIG